MPETAAPTDATPPAAPAPGRLGRSFGRKLFGYHRGEVDAEFVQVDAQLMDLSTKLESRTKELEETREELQRIKTELRYHTDRETFIEGEISRARAHAEAIERDSRERASLLEREAKERAAAIEREAKDRASHIDRDSKDRAVALVERVCADAGTILQQARSDARDLSDRMDSDARMAAHRVDHLRGVQVDLQRAIRGAIESFEDGMRKLERAPATQAAEVQVLTNTLRIGPMGATAASPKLDLANPRPIELVRGSKTERVVPGLEREPAGDKVLATKPGRRAKGKPDSTVRTTPFPK